MGSILLTLIAGLMAFFFDWSALGEGDLHFEITYRHGAGTWMCGVLMTPVYPLMATR